jgi:hypothetical protein
MRNVFLLYMPPGNVEAMVHYRDTIQQRVPSARILPHVTRADQDRLLAVFGDRPIAVWGSRDTPANRSKFNKMAEGDDLLIVEGEAIKFIGKVALKIVSPKLSRELWQNIHGDSSQGWDLIYFIANPVEVEVPFTELCRLFGYAANYRLQGFSTVSDEKLKTFYDRFDDLYSILFRIRTGQPVIERPVAPQDVPTIPLDAEKPDRAEAEGGNEIISDHVAMQWKLATLGLKAGQKVWVPMSDQARLRKLYQFDEFEREFSTGIDLPRNYVENIDVVWKEEYRIDAAFEIESTTAIYSGLLRFSDLNVLAPNTMYPMFIVAPAQRREQIRQQLLRPTFKRLSLSGNVRFLPYEIIDEVERFFSSASTGVSVDVLRAKAETLT